MQYPGIGDAVRADMKNLGVLLRLARTITPELDIKAVGAEIRERIVEELDYELEASNQRGMARLYAGHPFILVPGVVTSLCRERVIVTELVEGDGFEALRAEPEAERDRIGEIVFRFYFGSMYRHRRFSGDPHPGNMIRIGDGRVAFLDFGLFKTIDASVAALELACQRATSEGNAAELHRLMSDSGFLPRGDRLRAEELLEFVRDGIGWYATDGSCGSTRSSSTGPSSRSPTRARPTSTPPATRTSPPSTSSAAASSCSRWRCSASSRLERTGTGSPASGCTTSLR